MPLVHGEQLRVLDRLAGSRHDAIERALGVGLIADVLPDPPVRQARCDDVIGYAGADALARECEYGPRAVAPVFLGDARPVVTERYPAWVQPSQPWVVRRDDLKRVERLRTAAAINPGTVELGDDFIHHLVDVCQDGLRPWELVASHDYVALGAAVRLDGHAVRHPQLAVNFLAGRGANDPDPSAADRNLGIAAGALD